MQKGSAEVKIRVFSQSIIEDNFFKKIIADIANSTVKFDEKGDGLGRYTIYNYQVDKDNKTDYKVRYPYNSGSVKCRQTVVDFSDFS